MLMVSSLFKANAANASCTYVSNANSRIFIYKGTKPSNIQATPFTVSTFSSDLLITFVCATGTFTNTGSTVHFGTTPANATATGTGTAAWAAISNPSTGTPSYVVLGDVSLSSGNGMVYLPTLNIISGTSYSILECSWTFI